MMAFGMVGNFSTKPEDRHNLVEILTQATNLMKTVEGCHLYVVSTDADDATKVWVMELWASKEAHDQSLTIPEVRDLITQARPLIQGMPEGATLQPIAGKGLPNRQ